MKNLCKCFKIVLVACGAIVVVSGCSAPATVAYEPSMDGTLSVTIEEADDAIVEALSQCGSGYHPISYRDIDVGASSLLCTPSCHHTTTTYYPNRVPYSNISTTVMSWDDNVFWVDTGGFTYKYTYYDAFMGNVSESRALEFYWTMIEPARRFADALFLLKQAGSGVTPLTYVERGRILRDQGKLDEAREYARKALEYYPRLAIAFTEKNLLDVLDMAKRRETFEGAFDSAQQAEASGDAATAFEMYCKAYAWTPDPTDLDKARVNIMRLYPKLTTPPELPEYARRNFVQAEWHVKNEAYERSVESFKKVTLCCPWHAQSYYNRGLILGQLKRYSEAIKEMNQYLALAPEAANARAVQDRIYMWEAEQAKQ